MHTADVRMIASWVQQCGRVLPMSDHTSPGADIAIPRHQFSSFENQVTSPPAALNG